LGRGEVFGKLILCLSVGAHRADEEIPSARRVTLAVGPRRSRLWARLRVTDLGCVGPKERFVKKTEVV